MEWTEDSFPRRKRNPPCRDSSTDEFNVPDGDTILRTQGSPNRDFRVHKLILSLASPVFRDMFGIPRPPNASNVCNEVIDVTYPPQALDLFLRLIYPFPPPNVDSLDLLVEGLVITDKYNIDDARARLHVELTEFVNEALRPHGTIL